MGASIVDLRDEIFTRISINKIALNYTFNNFVLEKTYLPRADLDEFDDNFPEGKMYLITLANDDISKSRSNVIIRNLPIHIGFQRRVNDVNDVATLDTFMEFMDEIKDTCRKEIDTSDNDYSFRSLDSLRSDEDTPYEFEQLRQLGLFEMFFTTRYDIVLTGK